MYSRIELVKTIRKKLQNQSVSIGSWMQLNSTDVAEIMGQNEFDWIAIDMEHGSICNNDLPNLFRSIEIGGTLPLVRISEGTLSNCKQALDAGAGGLIIPMVMDSVQLEQVISWCSWPPTGSRGVGFSRANLFGKNFEKYKDEAQSPLIIAQIEHIDAIDNLESICNVKGLDATIIGPYDISASMGYTGELDNPEVLEAFSRVSSICSKKNIPSGIHVINAKKSNLNDAISQGYRFIAFSIDAVFLYTKLQDLKQTS